MNCKYVSETITKNKYYAYGGTILAIIAIVLIIVLA